LAAILAGFLATLLARSRRPFCLLKVVVSQDICTEHHRADREIMAATLAGHLATLLACSRSQRGDHVMLGQNDINITSISAAQRHSKWRNGKGVRILILTRRKMRDFARFRAEMCTSKSPLILFYCAH
jgi:hypothetical protein